MSLIENRYDSLLARETLEEAQDGHDTQIIGDLLIDQEGALSYVTISCTFGKAHPKSPITLMILFLSTTWSFLGKEEVDEHQTA